MPCIFRDCICLKHKVCRKHVLGHIASFNLWRPKAWSCVFFIGCCLHFMHKYRCVEKRRLYKSWKKLCAGFCLGHIEMCDCIFSKNMSRTFNAVVSFLRYIKTDLENNLDYCVSFYSCSAWYCTTFYSDRTWFKFCAKWYKF